MNKLKDLQILGVCAGNGTVLYPFRKNLVGNIELRTVFKSPDNIQWKANFGDIPLFNKTPLYWDLNEKIGKAIDVLIGHPDCGHSSVLSYSRAKKLTNPGKNDSVQLFVTSVELLKPKIFLFENLPAFLNTQDPETLFPGYNLKVIKGPVSRFGNSQKTRKRLVIIGIRTDLKQVTSSNFKLPSKESLHLKKVKELEAAPINPYDAVYKLYEDIDKQIAIFGGKKLTYREIQKYWKDNPDRQRFATGEDKMKNAPGVYRNLPHKLPLTVRKGNREFNSNGLPMNPRERARIMGIPEEFRIWFNPKNITNTINKGNITVTKCFPYEISIWFKKCLIKIIKKHGTIK